MTWYPLFPNDEREDRARREALAFARARGFSPHRDFEGVARFPDDETAIVVTREEGGVLGTLDDEALVGRYVLEDDYWAPDPDFDPPAITVRQALMRYGKR